MTTRTIYLPAISDMHLHLREGEMLSWVAPYSAHCRRVLVMPNTSPAILTARQAIEYKNIVKKYMPYTEVLTTIKLAPSTTPEIIRECKEYKVTAVKLYPHGVTTNSDDGISAEMLWNPTQKFLDVIEEIRKSGLVLCMHGEMPGEETKDREKSFLSFVNYLAANFPGLKMVLEHISTKEQVIAVRELAKKSHIAATITAHHLYLTMDDIIGDKLRPHNFCKPIPKWKADREALIKAATSDEPCFFLGSDSAPHLVGAKESCEGCAGVFSAPVLVPAIIEIFDINDKLSRLPEFISQNANEFYGLPRTTERRMYQREEWTVPAWHNTIVPFLASQKLSWKMCK